MFSPNLVIESGGVIEFLKFLHFLTELKKLAQIQKPTQKSAKLGGNGYHQSKGHDRLPLGYQSSDIQYTIWLSYKQISWPDVA